MVGYCSFTRGNVEIHYSTSSYIYDELNRSGLGVVSMRAEEWFSYTQFSTLADSVSQLSKLTDDFLNRPSNWESHKHDWWRNLEIKVPDIAKSGFTSACYHQQLIPFHLKVG